jgi:hemoglobin
MIDEPALARLVETFYARVRGDALIGPIFNDAIADWPAHLGKLQAFWSSVMLTSGRYKGRPMPAHLKHADRITDPTFARWLAIWRQVAGELFPPDEAAALQDRAARIADSLRFGMAFHRDPEQGLKMGAL